MITQNWKHKGFILASTCILIVSFMALSLSLVSCAQTEQATTFESIIITGTGHETSQPFRVNTKEWVANWSYVPYPKYPELAVFQFFIYRKGETSMFAGFMLSPEGTSGSYSYTDAGEYYIKVVAENVESWEIVISPP
ncbi:hypothetical protein ACFLTS_01955 [Chloroflexota bacterium]